MKRHAYLIIAYSQWNLLEKLIHMLDDERNDIYIHINSLIKEVPFEKIKNVPKHSRIIFVKRIPIKRGTYSIFEAEMTLLKTALAEGEYSYFHLLSGQDLPLKNQDYIHNFFDENMGKNFIDVISPEKVKRDWYERYSLYLLLIPYTLDRSLKSKLAKMIQKAGVVLQRILKVNRFKKFEKHGYELCYGSSWFSITNEFASYLVSKETFIKQMYERMTFIPEESIQQTFLWSSEFKNTLYSAEWLDGKLNRANLRMIFWTGKTSPETLSMKHFDQLKSTHNLFARKFDINKYPDVIDAVEQMVLNKEVCV